MSKRYLIQKLKINLTIQNEVKLMLKKKQWYFICDWNIMFLIYDVFLISCYFNKREQKKLKKIMIMNEILNTNLFL